jgi:hypothetical protein
VENQDNDLDEWETPCEEDVEQCAENNDQNREERLVVRFNRVGRVVQLCEANDETCL